ncbi:MAG: hypothetical protein JOZ78_17665 [Chroococcidiopsidaceae cyanobacterium CP_BM_ER_R8_30]|nr:hypothetical protein [Chroococcidiopsidaceae cyanobacterium CP_BM_ER_R8_30]
MRFQGRSQTLVSGDVATLSPCLPQYLAACHAQAKGPSTDAGVEQVLTILGRIEYGVYS